MSLHEPLEERRKGLKAENETLISKMKDEARGLTDEESTKFDANIAEIRKIDGQINELRDAEVREAAAAAHRAETATVEVKTEPNPVYRKDDQAASFFRDLFSVRTQRGDVRSAQDRLVRSQETRADLSTAAGAGGEFAPPLWLVDEFVALARPGRVTADIVNGNPLPSGVSSINLPRVATGTSAAEQTTQNTAVSDTALTTDSVSADIKTVAGKQVVSMQLLEQSGIPFDRVILSDLARSYAVQIDTSVITAISALSGANAVGVTATGVTAAGGLYLGVANGIQGIETSRFMPPTAIVMHPRRWMALVATPDSNGRPLVVPDGPAFNQVATTGPNAAQGRVGTMLGVPVYTDPSVPTNKGAATNQDQVYVMVAEDLWLYESQVQSASFDATYADQASVLFRVLGYHAFLPNRYPKSVAVLDGAGLVPPTF